MAGAACKVVIDGGVAAMATEVKNQILAGRWADKPEMIEALTALDIAYIDALLLILENHPDTKEGEAYLKQIKDFGYSMLSLRQLDAGFDKKR